MPRLPTSRVAALLGISDRTICRAINSGDLKDYQNREAGVALPKYGPRFYLIDLEEAHAYFHEKGLLGRIPAPENTDVAIRLLQELADVKRELALISAIVRGASGHQPILPSPPSVSAQRESISPDGYGSTRGSNGGSDAHVQHEWGDPRTRLEAEERANDDGDESESDWRGSQYQREGTGRASTLLAFGVERIGTPRMHRGPQTIPLRSDVVYVQSEQELPAGTIKPREFALKHNVPLGTLKSQIQERRVSSHAIRTQSRNQRLDRFLTPEDQESVVNHWTAMGTRYRKCLDCPHLVVSRRPGSLGVDSVSGSDDIE